MEKFVEELLELIHGSLSETDLLERLSDYHEKDIADAFLQLSAGERQKLYSLLGTERLSEIF